jgi:flagellar biosynthesis/type III secretory pathway chaperone
MSETYIEIMLQSLRKKCEVLDEIIRLNEQQRQILEDAESSVEDFDRTVEDKAARIEQLEQLDSGFEKLYERTKEELQAGGDTYASQIRSMQEYIRRVTDKSVEAQAQEARNKDLMTQKFSRVKKQARQLRTNSRATASYHQSMSRTAVIDPQFMDNKK